MRRPLQRQIELAWENVIQQDYERQRVNSERSLQASLWSQLNVLLPPKTRRIFIEPALSIAAASSTKNVIPDFVICNSRQVIAVVELKYQPRMQPSFRKDIETLRAIASNRSGIFVANCRYRGERSFVRSYPVANKALFIWAGVHREPPTNAQHANVSQPFNAGVPELEGCYLELHAETSAVGPPRIYSRRC